MWKSARVLTNCPVLDQKNVIKTNIGSLIKCRPKLDNS